MSSLSTLSDPISSLASPRFVRRRFDAMYKEPIMSGSHKDSSKRQIEKMKIQNALFHQKTEPMLLRARVEILTNDLPAVRHTVLYVRPSELQQKLITVWNKAIKKVRGSGDLLVAASTFPPNSNSLTPIVAAIPR